MKAPEAVPIQETLASQSEIIEKDINNLVAYHKTHIEPFAVHLNKLKLERHVAALNEADGVHEDEEVKKEREDEINELVDTRRRFENGIIEKIAQIADLIKDDKEAKWQPADPEMQAKTLVLKLGKKYTLKFYVVAYHRFRDRHGELHAVDFSISIVPDETRERLSVNITGNLHHGIEIDTRTQRVLGLDKSEELKQFFMNLAEEYKIRTGNSII